MNLVRIQLNHTEHLTLKELSSPFYAEIGEEYDFSEEVVEALFTIESQLLLPNATFVTVFSLDFPELGLRDQTPQDIVKSYLDTLKQRGSILSIVKTSDFSLFERAQQYYQDIIGLEMEIRNVFTYIMAYDDREVNAELFKFFNVPTVKSFQSEQADRQYENGFFYILFSQYAEFLEPKQLVEKDVIALLRNPSIQTFELFRERVIPKGVLEERHINFLSSISPQVRTIEDMRNAIMHVRHLSERLVQNYEQATDYRSDTSIMRLISEFWGQERELLKPQTWLALAKSRLRKVISVVRRDDGIIFNTNNEYYDSGLEEEYTEIASVKADLIPYLIEYVKVRDFDPETPAFEERLSEMVDSTLQEMANALANEQQQVELEQPNDD